MDLNGYLIVIGILVVAVIYLQLRLSLVRPHTVVMVPPTSQTEGPGCAIAALVILAIGIGIVLAVVFGPAFGG